MLLKFRPKSDASKKPHIWDATAPLIDLTGQGDWITIGQMCTGLAVFSSTGSGKTSSMASLAYALMRRGAGFLWLCVKPEEAALAMRIATVAKREQDVIVFGEGLGGQITEHRFNPLAYEVGIPTTSTNDLVTYLGGCSKVLSRREGESGPAEGERFWQEQQDRVVRFCIKTLVNAGEPLTVAALRNVQLSAPKNREQLSSDEWTQGSYCWECLQKAEARVAQGQVSQEDFRQTLSFWLNDWVALDTRPRSSIDVGFAALTDAFVAEEPLRTLLTTTSTVTPDDLIDGGKIVILSLPTSVYGSSGRMAQYAFKTSFQRAMLRRKKPSDGTPLRPCVLWVDEAHSLASPTDASYFAECRSARGINVYLEQGVGGYMRALSLHHIDAVDGFLQNLATKIFFHNNSPQTNHFAAEAIGKTLITKTTENFSAGIDHTHIGESNTQEERHQVISGAFGLLRRGGPENGGVVDGIVLKPGIFHSTGKNFALCHFQQTDLTR